MTPQRHTWMDFVRVVGGFLLLLLGFRLFVVVVWTLADWAESACGG